MSKSSKKKRSKGVSTGTTLGALALVLAIVAVGLGVYQIILTPEAQKTYAVSHDDFIYIDTQAAEPRPELTLNYTTKAGDSVLLEFATT